MPYVYIQTVHLHTVRLVCVCVCYRLLQVRDADADDDAVSSGCVLPLVVPGNSRACRVAVCNRLLPRAIMFGVSSRTQRHVAETERAAIRTCDRCSQSQSRYRPRLLTPEHLMMLLVRLAEPSSGRRLCHRRTVLASSFS